DRPGLQLEADRDGDQQQSEHLRLRGCVQPRRHVPEPHQADRGREAQERADEDQQQGDDVEDLDHRSTSESRRATKRAIETDPKTPTAATISSTGRVRVWWLMAISAPSAQMRSVRSTSEATARSRIDGPMMMRQTVMSAATPKTAQM